MQMDAKSYIFLFIGANNKPVFIQQVTVKTFNLKDAIRGT